MKKKLVSALLTGAMALSLVACGGANDEAANTETESQAEAGTEAAVEQNEDALQTLIENSAGTTVDLTLWVSEEESWQTCVADLVEQFKATYPDVTFNITIGAESEANTKDDILKDVAAGPDVFAFADDQINELVAGGALQPVNATFTYDVANSYTDDAITDATVDGTLYAYPICWNGYYLYYDSAYVTAEQAQSWEGILEACQAGDNLVAGMDFGNAWYMYGWFAGTTGLTCTLADNGVDNTCDWNSEVGAAVAQYVTDLCANDEILSISDADSRTGNITVDGTEKHIIAYIDGPWADKDYAAAYGDTLCATKLPTFTTADGNTYQMGGFKGYKLMGVNPNSANIGWAMVLAEFLTNAESQTAIFNAVGQAPANVDAAAVASSPAIDAAAEQSPYSDYQRVGGNFWTPGATLGTTLYEGCDDVQSALDLAVEGITAAQE